MSRATAKPSRSGFFGPKMKPTGWRGRRKFRPVVTELENRRLLALITLAEFNGANGSFPTSLAVDSQGNIYGTAGGGLGTVFKIASGTNTISTLGTFDGTNGDGPDSIVQDGQGNLYGATYGGGFGGLGTVFEITKEGEFATNLISCNNAGIGDNPVALAVSSNGALYVACLNGPGVGSLGIEFSGEVLVLLR